MGHLGVALGGLLLGVPGGAAAPFLEAPEASAEPPCAVWVVRDALVTREAWERTLAAVERAGCRRVYLQVSGRWDAYYPSAVFAQPATPPRGPGWADDAFGRALADARSRGIEVHAWVNALLAWSSAELPPDPAHPFRDRPEWFVTRGGTSMRSLSRAGLDRAGLVGEGWFLDAAREEVRTELRRFVLELATRYAVDGVHLDYIRYPTGWVPPEGPAHVSRLVGLIRRDLRAARPGATLSAAVMPRPDIARASFGQDWAEWLAEDRVDEVVPMVYRETPGGVVAAVDGWPAGVPRERAWIGLRIDRLDPAEVAEIGRRLEGRVAGLALFSHVLLLQEPAWR